MKKIVLILSMIPLFGISQTKNVIVADKIFPKTDKVAEFEKVLSNHAQKYHTGDWKWRVYDILSGPDAGGVMVVEGPSSWDDLDRRGNISAEHSADFTKNISPFTSERGNTTFAVYLPDLSTVQLTDFTPKIAINHVYLKPGYINEYEELLKTLKKVWEAAGQTVAVYSSSSSGTPQYLIVFRYKTGWKERDLSAMKPFKERFEAVNGPGSFQSYAESIRKMVETTSAEMLEYNADLSSK